MVWLALSAVRPMLPAPSRQVHGQVHQSGRNTNLDNRKRHRIPSAVTRFFLYHLLSEKRPALAQSL